MTQAQINHQVARITGKPLGILLAFGFSLLRPDRDENEPEDIKVVVDCPSCGNPVPYPGRAGDGSEALAECERCDAFFGFSPEDAYTIPAERA